MRPDRLTRGTFDARTFLILSGIVLGLYLVVPFVLRGFRYPVGPDASVYLWWVRLAEHDGLSVLRNRAGMPAVAIVAARALDVSSVTLLAAFPCVVATTVGLAGAAFLRDPDRATRRRAILAGALVAAYAAAIAAGYYSTLALAGVFLAAVVCLTFGTTRGALLAGLLLVATGLTHPELAALGAVVLLCTAMLSWRAGRRDEVVRVGGALAAGSVGSVLGGLALLAGSAPLGADTSRDLFLIRAGMSDLLERLYVHRLALHVWTYVPFAWVPLAAFGVAPTVGFRRRVLVAWAVVTGAVVLVGAATGWFPPERALSFAFVLPLLAASGADALLARRHSVGGAVVGLGVLAVVAAAAWTWWHAAPPVYEVEAARATQAARYAAASPPGTPLVFQVAGTQPVLTFFATRAANEFRAAVPAERIRDVYVVVPPPPVGSDAERRALSSISDADVDAAVARTGLAPLTFRLTAFIRGPFPEPPGGLPAEASPGVRVLGTAPTPLEPESNLDPTTAVAAGATAVAALVLLTISGLGWSRAVGGGDPRALLLAPAVGLGVVTIAAVALERLGLPIERAAGAGLVLAVAAVPGWIVAVRTR